MEEVGKVIILWKVCFSFCAIFFSTFWTILRASGLVKLLKKNNSRAQINTFRTKQPQYESPHGNSTHAKHWSAIENAFYPFLLASICRENLLGSSRHGLQFKFVPLDSFWLEAVVLGKLENVSLPETRMSNYHFL